MPITIAALSHCKTLNIAKISPICFSDSRLIARDVKDVQDSVKNMFYVVKVLRNGYRHILCIEYIGFPVSLIGLSSTARCC